MQVCTPKKTGRSKTAKTADAVGGFAKQNFDNRPFCVAKCFDRLTAQDGAVAEATFVYESHDQRLSPLAAPLSRTRISYGKPKLRRNAAQFFRFSKV